MEQSKILTSTRIKPEIALKMRINQYDKKTCPTCKRTYLLGDLKPALYIENIDSGKFRSPSEGGNGYNYRCPNCKNILYAPRW
jgi:hypothetical protein